MATVADVIDDCNDFYNEIDDTESLRHFQRAHSRILRAIPLEPTIVTFSSLVADTREYSTGDTYLRVWSARYVRSATAQDSKMLKEISVDELDLDFEDWRAKDSSEPEYWYWRAGNLGFHNKPDTTTSGGYPNVSLEVSADETVTAATTMPGHVRNFEAWIFDIIATCCLARSDERYQFFEQKRKEAFAELVRAHQGRTARLHPKVSPDMGSFDIERI